MIEGQEYTFGVSGMLYKSNVLFYDHQTESLWSQLLGKAISGTLAGKEFRKIEAVRISWKSWRTENPDTSVLSTKTGYQRDYSVDPYEGYYRVGTIWFPVGDIRTDFSPKERVLGIEIGGKAKAYPVVSLSRNQGVLEDRVNGNTVYIRVNARGEVVAVNDRDGKPISHMFSYWFAWQAFHPGTEAYQPE